MSSPKGRDWQSPMETFFDEESGYLVVRLDPGSYGFKEEPVKFLGKTFQPKDELHITILSGEAAEAVQEHCEYRTYNCEQVRSLIGATDWSYRKRNQ